MSEFDSNDTRLVLEAIAAISDGLRARDKQLDAIAQQMSELQSQINQWNLISQEWHDGERLAAIESKLAHSLLATLTEFKQLKSEMFHQFEVLSLHPGLMPKPRRAKKGKKRP